VKDLFLNLFFALGDDVVAKLHAVGTDEDVAWAFYERLCRQRASAAKTAYRFFAFIVILWAFSHSRILFQL
jgi:hypothetical protein